MSIKEKKKVNKRLPWLIQTICPNCIALCLGKQGAHSAEVRALAPVFEKSVTELKLKSISKLLRRKNTVHTVMFNVKTSNRVNQLPELMASAAEHNRDIICI